MKTSFAVGSVLLALVFFGLAWQEIPAEQKSGHPTLGTIDRLDPRFDRLVPRGAVLEKLAEGFTWTEGPVWVPGESSEAPLEVQGSFDDLKGTVRSYLPGGYLLFSDIPRNSVFKW